MKKKYKQYAAPQLAGYGLLFALLLSGLPHIYAEERAGSPAVKPKEERVKRNQPMESDTTRETTSLVGPSGQDIHDFLYPMPKVSEAVTPAN